MLLQLNIKKKSTLRLCYTNLDTRVPLTSKLKNIINADLTSYTEEKCFKMQLLDKNPMK